jgi:hypothetical protein
MAYIGNLSKYQVDYIGYTGAAATRVVFDWQNLRTKSIQVHNSGAAYTSAVIDVSNDGTHYGTLTAIAGGTLATNTTWQYTDETAYKYYRFCAVVASGTINLAVKFA